MLMSVGGIGRRHARKETFLNLMGGTRLRVAYLACVEFPTTFECASQIAGPSLLLGVNWTHSAIL